MSAECLRWRQALHEWLDGDADEETAWLAQAHWRTCPHCQQVVAEWQKVTRWMQEALSERVSPQWEGRWRQRFRRVTPSAFPWHGLAASWLLTVGGCFVAVKGLDWSLASFTQRLTAWLAGTAYFPTVPAQWMRQVWEWLSRSV